MGQCGRPPVLDAVKRAQIVAVLSVGCSLSVAANYAGCSRSTIQRTAERDPTFAASLRKAKSDSELGLVKNIRSAAKKDQYWRAAAWALERGFPTNQFQDLLAGEFEAEFRRQGILGPRPAPIENQTAKQVRIRRLGPYLSSGRVRFKANSPGTRLLVEQLGDFPIGDHDDGPDALEMALRLAGQVLHGRSFNDGLGRRLPVG